MSIQSHDAAAGVPHNETRLSRPQPPPAATRGRSTRAAPGASASPAGIVGAECAGSGGGATAVEGGVPVGCSCVAWALDPRGRVAWSRSRSFCVRERAAPGSSPSLRHLVSQTADIWYRKCPADGIVRRPAGAVIAHRRGGRPGRVTRSTNGSAGLVRRGARGRRMGRSESPSRGSPTTTLGPVSHPPARVGA